MNKYIEEYNPENNYCEGNKGDIQLHHLKSVESLDGYSDHIITTQQPDTWFYDIPEIDFHMFDIIKSIYSKERVDTILELFTWIEMFSDSETSTAILHKELDEKFMFLHINELKQKIYQGFENYSYHEVSFEYLNDSLKIFGNRDCANYLYAREARYLVKDFYQVPFIPFFKDLYRKGYLEDIIYYMYNPYEIWHNLDSSKNFVIEREIVR